MKFKSWFIFEEVSKVPGLDELTLRIKNQFDVEDSLIEHIKNFIINSGVPEIKIESFQHALAASFKDRVILNPSLFSYHLPFVLYVIFHEIAHQYQYKKHGFYNMWAYFKNEISTKDAVKVIRRIEYVADNYALKKLRQLQNVHGEKIDTAGLSRFYDSASDEMIARYIDAMKTHFKHEFFTDKETVAANIYNSPNRKV